MTQTDDTLAPPTGVTSAPSHPNPYPYYGRLAREQPMFHDEAIGWIAAGAAAVREVLESPDCLTRPAPNRVPAALDAGRMGDLFGRLVRMNDGPAHHALKPAILAAVRGVDLADAAARAKARAPELEAELGGLDSPAQVTGFIFALPVQVLAALLGVPSGRHGEMMTWLGDYGAATAAVITGIPAPTPDLIARGHAGANGLLTLIADVQEAPGPLFHDMLVEGRRAGCSEVEILANTVGLLAQGYGAMASLAGLALMALARRPDLQARVADDRSALRRLMQEVLRADPCTNSTLRFMARNAVIAGQQLREGEKIVVLIAAANHDPQLNPDPDRFDIDRPDRRMFELGAGRHACPADRLAPLLSEVTVEYLLSRNVALDRLEPALTYAASAHIRAPRFG